MNQLERFKRNSSRWIARMDSGKDMEAAYKSMDGIKGKYIRRIAREAAYESYTYGNVPLDVLATQYGVHPKEMQKWIQKVEREYKNSRRNN